MVHKVNRQEELTLPLPLSSAEKPKLTMKLLYDLITKLQHDNLILTKRIEELDQHLDLFYRTRAEMASADELPALGEPELSATMVETAENERSQSEGLGVQTNHDVLPRVSLIPRSERHFSPKKKFLWILW